MPMTDEDDPTPTPRRLQPLALDMLGVSELDGYIEELEAEINRVRGEIARKKSHRAAADIFFKPPG